MRTVNEIDQNLLTGEKVLFETTKHWFSPVRDSALAVLIILGSFLVRGLSPTGEGILGTIGRLADVIANGALIVSALWIAWNVFAYFSAHFGVTNMRVLRYEGIVQRRSSETLLSAITDVRLREPGLGRMLGYGDLQVYTAAGDMGKDEFSTIKDAGKMRTMVLEQKMAGPGGVAPTAAAAPVAATAAAPAVDLTPTTPADAQEPAADPAATLARLGEMRDQGLITAEDYEAKKTEILGRM